MSAQPPCSGGFWVGSASLPLALETNVTCDSPESFVSWSCPPDAISTLTEMTEFSKSLNTVSFPDVHGDTEHISFLFFIYPLTINANQASISAHAYLQTHPHENIAVPLTLLESINYLSTCRVISDKGWILAWICKCVSLSMCIHSHNVQVSAALWPAWSTSNVNVKKKKCVDSTSGAGW